MRSRRENSPFQDTRGESTGAQDAPNQTNYAPGPAYNYAPEQAYNYAHNLFQHVPAGAMVHQSQELMGGYYTVAGHGSGPEYFMQPSQQRQIQPNQMMIAASVFDGGGYVPAPTKVYWPPPPPHLQKLLVMVQLDLELQSSLGTKSVVNLVAIYLSFTSPTK